MFQVLLSKSTNFIYMHLTISKNCYEIEKKSILQSGVYIQLNRLKYLFVILIFQKAVICLL